MLREIMHRKHDLIYMWNLKKVITETVECCLVEVGRWGKDVKEYKLLSYKMNMLIRHNIQYVEVTNIN